MSSRSGDLKVRLAVYAGVLAAHLAILQDDPWAPVQAVSFLAASLWSLGGEPRHPRLFLNAPLRIVLIVLGSFFFLAAVLGETRGGGGRFAGPVTRLLTWNAILFVLSRHTSEQDLWTLVILGLSLFGVSGALVQPPLFLPLLAAGTAFFLLAFQRMALLRCGPVGLIGRGGLGLFLRTFLLVLGVGGGVFIALPRSLFRPEASGAGPSSATLPEGSVQAVAPRLPSPERALNLTDYTGLRRDSRPVVWVRITPDPTPYLRGDVRWRYSAGWQARNRDTWECHDEDDERLDGQIPLREGPPPQGRFLARAHIRAAPLAGDLAFTLPDPLGVTWRAPNWTAARYDAEGVLFYPELPRGPVEYDLLCALPPPDAGPLLREGIRPPRKYLRLPPGLDRLKALARAHAGSLQEPPPDRAARLRDYLLTGAGLTYSLGPFVPGAGVDPAEHFLFEQKAGTCLHFATALVLLCRAAGVPARLATGFYLHSPEPDGSFQVRLSDAHAWTEVWLGPDSGWRVYDATPPQGRGRPPVGPSVATDAAATTSQGPPPAGPAGRWDRFIVGFDARAQAEALRRVAREVATSLALAGRFAASPSGAAGLGALLGVALLAYRWLPRPHRMRFRQAISGFRERTSVDFYRDFLWVLARRGVRKSPALTPLEFARQVKSRIPDDAIDFVTDQFYRTRYGGDPPGPQVRRRIDEAIDRLKAAPPKE